MVTFFGVVLTLVSLIGLGFVVTQTNKVPKFAVPALLLVLAIGTFTVLFKQMFFYAEPGYIYHVRTITGHALML